MPEWLETQWISNELIQCGYWKIFIHSISDHEYHILKFWNPSSVILNWAFFLLSSWITLLVAVFSVETFKSILIESIFIVWWVISIVNSALLYYFYYNSKSMFDKVLADIDLRKEWSLSNFTSTDDSSTDWETSLEI